MLPDHLIGAQTKIPMVQRQIRRYCQQIPELVNLLSRSEEEVSPYFETKCQIYDFMRWLTGEGDIELLEEVHRYAREYSLGYMDALVYLAVEKAMDAEISRPPVMALPREKPGGKRRLPWEEYMDQVVPGWDSSWPMNCLGPKSGRG